MKVVRSNLVKNNFKIIIASFLVLIFLFTGCMVNTGGGSEQQIPKNKSNQYYTDSYYKYVIYPKNYSENFNSNKILYSENFENYSLISLLGNKCKLSTDKILQKQNNNPTRATNILKDIHGKVCELNGDLGREAYFSIKVNIREKSILSFDFKSDIFYPDMLQLQIDEKFYKVIHSGYGETWKNISVSLPSGEHIIKWILPTAESYSPQLLNVIYIDNISIVKDEIETVEIYPKGLQETYVGGMNLKFSAVARRADGSIIENLPIDYSVSGCGTIDSNGLFKPTGKGNCTITASINGVTATKSDVVVHGKNYLSDEVNIGGHKFTGEYVVKSGENLDTENIKFDYPTTPMSVNFNTDGFFVLKGNSKNPLYIDVLKNGTNYKTTFLVRKSGDFYKRIWLRFGEGVYTVNIHQAVEFIYANPIDNKYEGDWLGYKIEKYPVKELHVRNTNLLSEQEAIWLMPSEVVQSDSFYVSNVAHSILSSLPNNATTGDKLRAIHDWELYNHYYDMVSVNHEDQRKRQDAVATLKYHMGVCEGYANLYAALVRHANIKAKVICDTATLKHAWNHVLYDNNQWYLVDVTWDDPVPAEVGDSYCDFAIGAENYTYFMTSHTDEGHTVPGVGQVERSAVGNYGDIPQMKGVPDGWY